MRPVKKLPKAILIVVAALGALALVALFGINLYLQSPGTQRRIEEELSAALRVPLRFTTTSLGPTGHLKITGITVPDGDRTFLEAKAFHAHCHVLPVFRGRLEIQEILVDAPKIVCVENAEGRWTMPTLPPAEKKPGPEPRQEEPKGAAKKRGGFQVTVGSFRVRGGSVTLLKKDEHPAAIFTGVDMHYTTLTAERVEGLAQIGRIVWDDSLTIEDVRTPFSYAGGVLTLPEVGGRLAGGRVTGNFKLTNDPWMSPFELALSFAEVNAGPLCQQFRAAPGMASGTLAGTLVLHGSSKRVTRAEGTGQLRILDGRFQQLEIFEAIGEALQIRELADLRLKDGHAEFHIGKERAYIDTLSLEASNLRLGATGTVRFNGGIQLDSELSLDEELTRQLPGIVRNNLLKSAEGRHAIPFEIKGDGFKLKSDLGKRIFSTKALSNLEDLGALVFGTKKKSTPAKDVKKKDSKKPMPKEEAKLPAEPTPEPAPPAAAQ